MVERKARPILDDRERGQLGRGRIDRLGAGVMVGWCPMTALISWE